MKLRTLKLKSFEGSDAAAVVTAANEWLRSGQRERTLVKTHLTSSGGDDAPGYVIYLIEYTE